MNKKYVYGLSGLLILFLNLILILCYYFRISTDDYFYIVEVERIGVVKVVTSSYLEWSGRFAAFAVLNSIFKILSAYPGYLFLVPLSTFILLIWGIFKTIGNILKYYHIGFNFFEKWVLSLSFLASLFFLSFDIGETWFWCTGNAVYLFCIVAFIWGLCFILAPQNNAFTYLAIVTCFTYMGGSSEVYSAIFLLIFLFIILFYFKQFRSGLKSVSKDQEKRPLFIWFLKNGIQRKLFIAFVSLSISSAIAIAAPGNYLRDQLLPTHQFFFSFFITAKSFVKFFILYIPLHLHFIIAFCAIFVFVGIEFRKRKSIQLKLEFLPFVKKITIYLVFILAVFFYLVAYIMSETGPARVWFLASFLFSIYCCSISFYAGYCGLFYLKWLRILKILSLFAMGIILSFSLISQTIVAKNYANAYDEREKLLLKCKNEMTKDAIVGVAPLPSPGMLYTSEITGDTNHYTNQHLRCFYKLAYQVVKN
jgi:hypothetical protein